MHEAFSRFEKVAGYHSYNDTELVMPLQNLQVEV